ncbi:MAG: tRNA guanosine(34) transglycosylase Tgt [bacterium]
MKFKITQKLDNALGRAGELETPHGTILTPAFVTVGTKGTVKGLTPEMIKLAGSQVVLANTYHLYLEPGDERVKMLGGFPKMMQWEGPSMTDSGGFQVFSLGVAYGKGISKLLHPEDPSVQIPERSSADDGVPRLATIGNDGVSFRSHIDGSLHYITPEKSMEIQHNLGADIIFAFDECTSPLDTERYQEEALGRTHSWAKRSLERHHRLLDESGEERALFGVIQGGRSESLRKKSAQVIADMKTEDGKMFDGFGIGGSFDKNDLHTAVKWVNEVLPEGKPRHLLGIGEPEDLFFGVENGVDLFDCVAPTRNGRTGTLYTHAGKINIKNALFRDDMGPIDSECGCPVCKNPVPLEAGSASDPLARTGYTRAYISHLYHSKEMLAGILGSLHNLYFINHLVADMRQAILEDRFIEFKEEFMGKYLSK